MVSILRKCNNRKSEVQAKNYNDIYDVCTEEETSD